MSPAILILLSFLAAGLAVAGVYSVISDLFLRDRARMSKRVDDEFRKKQREKASKSVLFKDLSLEAIASAQEEEAPRNLRHWFVTLVEQSGMELTPTRLLIYMTAVGLGLGAFMGLVRQSFVVLGISTLIGACIPLLFVSLKRKARLAKLASQLPDAFDLMARVLRAGQTMSQGLLAVADEFDQPIAAEFSYCFEQQNLGMPTEMALRDLAKRTGLVEIKVFVVALLVQQQTGGNIAEMLDKLAGIVRERFRMKDKIQALTAEGRMQAIILLALPLVVLLAMYILNRRYAEVLFNYPSLLGGMFIAEALGALWIRKIINFDF